MNYESNVGADYGEAFMADEAQPERNRRFLKLGLIVFALLALAAIGFAVWETVFPAGDDADASDQAQMVTVVSPGATSIKGEISATGSLSARREMPVGIAGEGGRVLSVPVDAGDWVKSGQVLAVIDRSVQAQQAHSAAAQIDVARADARLAQSNLERALKLVDRGFISAADVERLTATRDAASARVKVAQAQFRELRARTARLNVVAPASGLVLERRVEPGQIVSGGSGALFRIARDGEVELQAQLGEAELAQISVGVQAQIVPSGTDKVFTGEVWQVSPVISAQNRQGIARIALPPSPELRPGGFATATISSGTIVAPMLPESSILSDNEGSFVYLVDKDGKVVRRSVKTGLVTPDGIAVIDGLDGSEKVVLRAGGFLNPGETVRSQVYKKPGGDKSVAGPNTGPNTGPNIGPNIGPDAKADTGPADEGKAPSATANNAADKS